VIVRVVILSPSTRLLDRVIDSYRSCSLESRWWCHY